VVREGGAADAALFFYGGFAQAGGKYPFKSKRPILPESGEVSEERSDEDEGGVLSFKPDWTAKVHA